MCCVENINFNNNNSVVILTEKLRKCEHFFPKVFQLILVDIGPNKPHKNSQEKYSVSFVQNGFLLEDLIPDLIGVSNNSLASEVVGEQGDLDSRIEHPNGLVLRQKILKSKITDQVFFNTFSKL